MKLPRRSIQRLVLERLEERLAPSADLAVVLAGPVSIMAGTQATYEISVTNNGPSDAQSVDLTDALPSGATLVSETQVTGSDLFIDTSGGNTASFHADTVAAGNTDTFNVVAQVSPSLAAGSMLTNAASIAGTTLDSDLTNNSSSFPSTITTSADLAVMLTGPATILPGTDIAYSLSLTNNGPSDAQSVDLVGMLPSNETLVSVEQLSGSDVFTGMSNGNTVTGHADTVGAGNTDTFAITVHVSIDAPVGGTITNMTTVTSATFDPDLTNNTGMTNAMVIGNTTVALDNMGHLVVTDVMPGGKNDTLTILTNDPATPGNVRIQDPNNLLQAVGGATQVDNHTVDVSVAMIQNVEVDTLAGDDTLTIDNGPGALFDPAGGIVFNGNSGTNSLSLTGNPGGALAGSYTTGAPDMDGNTGALQYAQTLGVVTHTQTINFTGLSPVEDLTPSASFTIDEAAGPNAINIVAGPVSTSNDPVTGMPEPTYQVNFAGAAELINFRNKGAVTVNANSAPNTVTLNLPSTVSESPTLTSLTLNGGVASSTFRILATPAGVTTTVNTGPGSDTIGVSSDPDGPAPDSTLDMIQGPVMIFGNDAGPSDTLNFVDTGNEASSTYVLTSNTLTRTGTATVTFTMMGLVNVDADNLFGSKTFDVQSTASGTSYFLSVDPITTSVVNVGAVNNVLDDIQGPLTIVGFDFVNFNDQGSSVSGTYLLTLTSFQRFAPATAPVFYDAAGTITINGGSGGNAFVVQSTVFDGIYIINTGTGADTVDIGSATNTLDTIRGALTIHGQDASGSDTLNFNDQGSFAAVTYDVTATTFRVSTPDTATVLYDVVAAVNLNAGNLGNTINVQSTATGTTYTINTGSGSDTVNVGNANNFLEGIQGPLAIHGQDSTPSDTLNLNDQGQLSAPSVGEATYILTATTFQRTVPASAQVTYDTVAAVTLNAANPDFTNLINIQSTAAGTLYTVNTGVGTDIVNVGDASNTLNGIQGALVIHNNDFFSGSDTLNFNDQGSAAPGTYVLTATTFQRTTPATALVTFDDMLEINLNAGSGGNTINIEATVAPSTMVNTGPGADTVNIGSDPFNLADSTLNQIQGNLFIHGQDAAASDTVNFNDARSGARTYVLTATTFTTPTTGMVTYDVVAAVNLNAGIAGNTINVQSTAAGTTYMVNTGPETDTVNVGDATNTLNGILGALVIQSQDAAATDTLNINDQGNAAPATYVLTATTFQRTTPATALVTYDPFAMVNLNFGNAGNTINIQSTAVDTTYTVATGTGADTVNVGALTNTLDGIQGALTIQGQDAGPSDTLNFNDQGGSASATYVLTATTFQRITPATALVTFDTVAAVNLNPGNRGNTIDVQATAAGTTTTITTGTGVDTVNVGDAANTLDGIQGTLIVHGHAGDALNFNDQGSNAPGTYVLTATTFQRTAPATAVVDYDPFATITLNAGNGGNTIDVQSTAAGTLYIINTGSGTDTVNIGDASNTLDGIQGNVNIVSQDSGAHSDTLNFNDQGSAAAGTYVLTATTFQRTTPGTAPVSYDTLAAVNLNAGNQGNIINVQSTAAGTTYTVSTGTGADTVNVGDGSNTLDGIVGALTIQGQDGEVAKDTLNFNDQGNTVAATYVLTATTFQRTLPTPATALVTYDTVTAVNLNAGNGGNTINVQSTSSTALYTVNTGTGIDTVNVGDTSNTVNGIQGELQAHGHAGDVLNYNDQGSAMGAYELTSFDIVRLAPPAQVVDYDTFSVVTLNAANQGNPNTIAVISTHANTLYTVNTGSGADTVNVGSDQFNLANSTLDTIQGALTIHSQDASASDTLNFNDKGNAVAGTYVLTATTLQRTTPATAQITYDTVAAVNLNAGNHGNTINARSTAANTQYTIATGNSADTVNVGDVTNVLDGIQGALTIQSQDGGAHSDTLNFNDQGSTTPATYVLTATTFQRTAPATAKVTFDTVAAVNVNAGNGGNTIDVQGTASGTQVMVFTGIGADTVNIGDTGNTLNGIQGPLTVIAQDATASDTLNFNDQGNAGAGTVYTLTATTFQRTNTALVRFDSPFALVNVNGGSAGNTYNVQGTAATTTSTVVNTGAGGDTVNIGSPANSLDTIQGAVTIHSQDASAGDTLNLNDQGNAVASTYMLTATNFRRTNNANNTALVTFDSPLLQVTLNAGSGGNTIDVEATAASTTNTVINSGTGTDTINVGNTPTSPSLNTLNAIQGALQIHSQDAAADDSLNFNDQANALADSTYTLTATTFQRTNAALVTFDSPFAAVTVNGGNLGSIYDIKGTAATTTNTIINTGSDTSFDTINVGSDPSTLANSKLDGIQGPLTIHSQESTSVDRLFFNDQGNSANNNTYVLTATLLTRTFISRVTFDTSYALVTLNGGSGTNTYEVEGTAASTTSTVLNTGTGQDTIVVGSPTRILDPIQGMLAIHSQVVVVSPAIVIIGQPVPLPSNGDVLVFNDQDNSAASTYTLMANAFMRSNTALVTFDGFLDPVTVNGGSGGNIYNVESTATSTVKTVVNTGPGADTINVSNLASNLNDIRSSLAIVGQDADNRDTLNLNDESTPGAAIYEMTQTSFQRTFPFSALITFDTLKTLNAFLGQGGDSMNITGTPLNATTNITGGAGNDGIFIHQTNGPTNLNGQLGNDQFSFVGPVPGGLNGGIVNGGDGFNTLDYSQYTGSSVAVNLSSSGAGIVLPPVVAFPNLSNIPPADSATGTGGIIHGTIENVIGGREGNGVALNELVADRQDRLEGGAQTDILVGNGNDILIAGGQSSQVVPVRHIFLLGLNSGNFLYDGTLSDIQSVTAPNAPITGITDPGFQSGAKTITMFSFDPAQGARGDTLLFNSCAELRMPTIIFTLQPFGIGTLDLVGARMNEADPAHNPDTTFKYLQNGANRSVFVQPTTFAPPQSLPPNVSPLQPATFQPAPAFTIIPQSDPAQGRLVAATGFLTSMENRNNLIAGYYQHYLGRTPDAVGIQAWQAAFAAGARQEDVVSAILGSAEYYQLHGGTNAGFIVALYHDLLGRTPAQIEVDGWLGVLGHFSRNAVAMGFLTSAEYRSDLINGWYEQYLGRSADPSGPNFWLTQMQQGRTQEQIQLGLLTSAEYQQRTQDRFPRGDSYVSYIIALYADILKRSAGQQEIMFWLGVVEAQ